MVFRRSSRRNSSCSSSSCCSRNSRSSSSSCSQFLQRFSIFCFSGFRSNVRHFFGGIFGLVRPPGPWCFPVRQGCVAVSLCSRGSSSSSNSSSSRSSVAWCFAGAAGGTSRSSSSSCSQFFAKIFFFFLQRFSILSRVSEATLDTFLVGFSD